MQTLPTPLTRLRWWRLCLDEAQMVETTTAKAAKLAVQIKAQHRSALQQFGASQGGVHEKTLGNLCGAAAWHLVKLWKCTP